MPWLSGLFAVLLFLGGPVHWAAPPAQAAVEAPVRLSPREAFERRRSGVWLRARGEVSRTLRDDLEGGKHQRFILKMPDGLTVLVSHNIDLAPRVPVRKGDAVEVFGRYEWNKRGGVIHWTHHDPKGRLEGGWVEREGEKYR